MLSLEGFRHHLSSIEHETKMYMHYKHEVSLKSVENSKQVLLKAFIDQQKEIDRLKGLVKLLSKVDSK